MWVIENLDDAGEGMFVCDAQSKEAALLLHDLKNKGIKVTSCEWVQWVDLALVSGERGESYYYERQRGRAPKRNWKCFMVKWLARSQASIERAEVREAWQREQRRIDAAVGRYNPNGITAEQAERNKRDIAEMLKRYPDLA